MRPKVLHVIEVCVIIGRRSGDIHFDQREALHPLQGIAATRTNPNRIDRTTGDVAVVLPDLGDDARGQVGTVQTAVLPLLDELLAPAAT